mmetsp:Transcript_114689/g.180561  ORF Transcript_114689/g.180561 Transcript_114689/m.180561 type:complete len:142 (-) Transcript_114689:67-492(-)|eukprot:CAMPEP_0169151532 /NCGR_PEP_ID=MMETSP1015-20121227/50893_1 /TAXON_ID=342587 /ORGANISM="Karlodinium micrum, Strain CCMP2283" /LENGTH=141 /DNA_ID=CAMNT_0009220991 /DNA_START=53 /DNA_END=478 /DNA_ORIENTATION=-
MKLCTALVCLVALQDVIVSSSEAQGAKADATKEEEMNIAQEVVKMRVQLNKMATAFKSAAGDESTPALKFIRSLADQCEEAIEKGIEAKDFDKQHEILSAALDKRDEWLAALSRTHEETTERHKAEERQDEFEIAMNKKEL